MKIAFIKPKLTDRQTSGGNVYNRCLASALTDLGAQLTLWDIVPEEVAGLDHRVGSKFPEVILQDGLFMDHLCAFNERWRTYHSAPVVGLIHGLPDGTAKGARLDEQFFRYLESCSALVFVSVRSRLDVVDRFAELPPSKVVEPGRLFPDPMPEGGYGELRPLTRSGKISIVSVVNQEPNKGFSRLVEWVQAFEDEASLRTEFHVVGPLGNKSERERLQGTLPNTIVHGELPFASLQDLLRQATFLLVPSFYETYCLAASEALAYGVPVITAAHGGIRDFIRDGVNGYWIDQDYEHQLRRIVTSIFEKPSDYKRMRLQARMSYEALPDWNQAGQTAYGFFQSLAAPC